jgi:hypothetical protein
MTLVTLVREIEMKDIKLFNHPPDHSQAKSILLKQNQFFFLNNQIRDGKRRVDEAT